METLTTETIISVYGAVVALGVLLTMLASFWFRVHLYPLEREIARYQLDLVRRESTDKTIYDLAQQDLIFDQEGADYYADGETVRSMNRVSTAQLVGRVAIVVLFLIFVLLVAVVPSLINNPS